MGRWVVRLNALGTSTGPYDDRELAVDVAVDGTVSFVGADRASLTGTWHQAGEGRVVLRAVGECGAVEAALELSEAGSTCAGRATARVGAGSVSWGEAATFVVEIDGRRIKGGGPQRAADPDPLSWSHAERPAP